MTRFQVRFFFFSFLALFVGTAVNALYFQDGEELKEARAKARIVTAALPKKNASSGEGAETKGKRVQLPARRSRSGPSVRLVKAIQRELKVHHYFPGDEDGVSGTITRAAIMAFEHDNGLALTGEPTEALLKRLLLGPSVLKKQVGEKEPNSLVAIQTTKAIQNVLAKLGYAPGAVDGMAGRETERAIRAFEKDRGLPQTGRISGRLVKELRRVTGEDLTA